MMPEGHFSARLWWLEEEKRHLAADGLHFSLVISLPHFFSKMFLQMYL